MGMRRGACAMLLVIAGLTAALAQGPKPEDLPTYHDPQYGRAAVMVPDPTTAGTWDGTWIHVNRDTRIAMWMRTVDGRPEAKLQYQSTSSPESFETDWNGKARYTLGGNPATFELKLTGRERDRLEGTWNWDVQFEDSGRTETGSFSVHRTGDGRALVVRFHDFERAIRRREDVRRAKATPVWGFTKVSKRLALWDELPF